MASSSNVPPETSQSASDEPYFDLNEPPGELIFEMDTPTTANRLVIPLELAEDYFPPVATKKQPNEKKYKTLKITDFHHQDWDMKLEYYSEEEGFILSGWQQFSTRYNVKPTDLIRFYEPRPLAPDVPNHFLIRIVKQEQRTDPPPEFKDENFLFRIKLDQSDIDFNRVFLAWDDVLRYFTGVAIPRHSGEKKIIRFTDAKCKDWYMDINRYDERKYMVMGGWDEFVKERGLEVEDLIRFYRHTDPYHSCHFLIRIAKKRGRAGPRPRPDEPGGGRGAGQDKPGGGSGAGSSSQSYKGKEIARGWRF